VVKRSDMLLTALYSVVRYSRIGFGKPKICTTLI
jgi:hypothetical protein